MKPPLHDLLAVRLEPLRNWIAAMPRRRKQFALIAIDFAVLVSLVWLSFSFRFDYAFVPNQEQVLLMLAAPAIAIPLFVRMGLYRSVLRYLPERAMWTIFQAVTFAVLLWVALAFLTRMTGAEGVPRTIPILYWVSSLAFMIGSRFGAKWLLSGGLGLGVKLKQTLIYGTGDAGVQLVNALRATNERLVVGFVSDDPMLQGMDLLGLRVYGPDEIERLVSNMAIDEIVITTSSVNAQDRRELVTRLGKLPVKVRILPPLADIAAGRYLVSFVRDVSLDDLLGRSEVAPSAELLDTATQARVVLITGAAGSIGSALARLLVGLSPSRIVLLDANEHGLYQIGRELAGYVGAPVTSVLGSITDRALLARTLAGHRVDVIFHCAAYKHVTLVEENVLQSVRNNVCGTHAVAEAALEAGVGRFILISSDKAVRPTSVMGATKRWSELIVRGVGSRPAPPGAPPRVFSSVRFGNVIGSSGSVVPLFTEQIAKGGPVTITHNDMTRYFMSVREAAELIVQASALSESGDILLLDMGEPVRIRELAEDMIALAGLTVRDANNPGGDIEIVPIGTRPGEKIREELFYDPSGVTCTAHPKILRARSNVEAAARIDALYQQLVAALDADDEALVRRILFEGVAG